MKVTWETVVLLPALACFVLAVFEMGGKHAAKLIPLGLALWVAVPFLHAAGVS